MRNNNLNQPINNSRLEEDRRLRELQRRELEEAERIDRARVQAEQERTRKEREEERQRIEEVKRKEQLRVAMEEEAKQKRHRLPEEPAEKDPLACHIVLRLPGSGERVNRRFLKNETVQVLYDFVDSLGPERLGFENSSQEYIILQSMPRKEFTDKDKKLEEVGLFPRAMLQIKENN